MLRNADALLKAYLVLSIWPALAFLSALGADLTYLATGDSVWRTVSAWAIGLGILFGLLAAIPGFTYFLRAIPRENSTGSKLASAHMVLDVALIVLFGFNLALRLVLGLEDPRVVWLGTYLTVVGCLELIATAFLGLRLWRLRRERIQVAMLRGELREGAQRRR